MAIATESTHETCRGEEGGWGRASGYRCLEQRCDEAKKPRGVVRLIGCSWRLRGCSCLAEGECAHGEHDRVDDDAHYVDDEDEERRLGRE